MKLLRFTFLMLAFLVLIYDSQGGQTEAQKTPFDTCMLCPYPSAFKLNGLNERNSVFDVKMKNDDWIYNCISIKRKIVDYVGSVEQAVLLKKKTESGCKDTIVLLSSIKELRIGNIGSTGQPLTQPIFPARMFYRERGEYNLPESFLEITPLIAYGGVYKNELNRNVGFSNLYYGAELLFNPFGNLIGKRTAFAFGGGLFVENSRVRIPVQVHLRWRIMGDVKVVERDDNFIPSPCQFGIENDKHLDPNLGLDDARYPYKEYQQQAEYLDSSCYYVKEKELMIDPFRPFLFVEGGWIFNGFSEGAGKNPSINPDDYAQYFAGAGLGLPLFKHLTVSLGLRYLRLNLRTPCETCDNLYILNTNSIFSGILKFGYRVNW